MEKNITMTRDKLEQVIERGINKYFVERDAYGGSRILDCVMREIDLEQSFCEMEEISSIIAEEK